MPRTLSVKAVVIGSVVDMFGATLGIAIGLLLFGSTVKALGGSDDQIKLYFQATTFRICAMVFGLSFSVLGGFVAARVAKARELLHGGATGMVRIAMSLLMLAISKEETHLPIWHSILIYVAVLPAALLGGHLGRLRSGHPTQ